VVITDKTIRQMIEAKVEPLLRRARGVVRRATMLVHDNAGGVARVQAELTKDEVVDRIEMIQPIGISSRPAAGAEMIVLAVSGNPDNLVAIPWVRGQRLTGEDLAEGEVALFIGQRGQAVHLKADGSVEVRSADAVGSSVVLKASGDVVVTPGAGSKVYLGADGALDAVALGPAVKARLDGLKTAIAGWVPVAQDGGAALKAALADWLSASNAVSATKVNAS